MFGDRPIRLARLSRLSRRVESWFVRIWLRSSREPQAADGWADLLGKGGSQAPTKVSKWSHKTSGHCHGRCSPVHPPVLRPGPSMALLWPSSIPTIHRGSNAVQSLTNPFHQSTWCFFAPSHPRGAISSVALSSRKGPAWLLL